MRGQGIQWPRFAWLLPLCLLAAATAHAQFSYVTNNGGITIMGYTGSGGAVSIPPAINDYPVTTIGTNAFFNCTNITSISIPGSVVLIDYKAFTQCTGLTHATISNGVLSIASHAFYYCKAMTNVVIPASVTNISSAAFRYCFALSTLTLDPANPAYSIFDGVLFSKDQTTLVLRPAALGGSYIIPSGVMHIADYALASCYGLTGVVIPEGVETIGALAFDNLYQLTSLTLPDSLKSIGNAAFGYCSGMTTLELGDGVTDIGSSAFGNCYKLEAVEIPTSVTNMGNNVFWSCRGLTNVSLPESLVTLGYGTFFGCEKLTSVVMPGAVRDIGTNTFYNCLTLTNVVLGHAVTNIGFRAFHNCPRLKSITLPPGVRSIGQYAFEYCFDLTRVFFAGNAPTNVGFSPFLSATPILYYLPGTVGWTSPFAGRPAVLWNPAPNLSDSSFGVGPGGFGFAITGTPNIPIVVEASTTFRGSLWNALQSCSLTNGSIYFADAQWTNYPSCLYRIRSP